MKIGKILLRPTLATLLLLAGCMTQKKAEKILSQTPEYFKNNLGPVKVEPFNPLFLFSMGNIAGYVVRNPEAAIHLSPLATKENLIHEAGHSFEFRQAFNNEKFWEEFYLDFYKGDRKGAKKYPGFPLSFGLLASNLFMPPPIKKIPVSISIGKLPVLGNKNLYSCINHHETVAGCTEDAMKGHRRGWDSEYDRKLDCVERFICGAYGKQSESKSVNTFLDDLMRGKELEKEIAIWRESYIKKFIAGEYGNQSELKTVSRFLDDLMSETGREDRVSYANGRDYIRSLISGAFAENPEYSRQPDVRTVNKILEDLMNCKCRENDFQYESGQNYIRRLLSGIYENSQESKNNRTVRGALEGVIR